jgi:hypothetical protein
VRTPTPELLAAVVATLGVTVASREDGSMAIAGSSVEAIGHAAWQANVELHELREDASSLEQTFLQLTASESQPQPRETPG